MTAEEILAKATPRPWYWEQTIRGVEWLVSESSEHPDLEGAHCPVLASDNGLPQSEIDANWELTVLAVNSFEKQRECIRELSRHLGEQPCCDCQHPLYLHIGGKCQQSTTGYGVCCCESGNEYEGDKEAIATLARAKELLK